MFLLGVDKEEELQAEACQKAKGCTSGHRTSHQTCEANSMAGVPKGIWRK